MNIRKHTAGLLLLAVLLIVVFGSCRTTIAFDAVIPAEVNMSEYRTIGVFDFSEYKYSSFISGGYVQFDILLQRVDAAFTVRLLLPEQVASYMTSSVVRTLDRTDYFSVVPPGQLKHVLYDTVPPRYKGTVLRNAFGVDALIVGSIEDMNTREYIQVRREYVINPDTKQREMVLRDYVIQEVYLEASYSVVAVDDGKVLATKRLDGRKVRETKIPLEEEMPQGWKTEDFRAPDVLSLYRSIIDDFQPQIRDQLAPRTVRQYRALMRDRSGDPRMELADGFVKDRLYRQALHLFEEVWYETRSYPAGYNAVMIYELLGDVERAVSLMREVAAGTGEPGAYRELLRLQEVRQQYYRAIEQL